MRNKSIRTQMIVYLGGFIILPLCVGLMILNIYLQRTIYESKINQQQTLLLQIKENAEQVIEVSNYVSSMMMTNRDVLDDLREIKEENDGFEGYQARENISAKIQEIESSTLNAVGGKIAILTDSGYLVGSYNISKSSENYKKCEWYQQAICNGREPIYSSCISKAFEEMRVISIQNQNALYSARSIRDYSGRQLGVVLIRLSDSNIWGRFTDLMYQSDDNSLYLYNNENKVQLVYNQGIENVSDILDKILNRFKKGETSGSVSGDLYFNIIKLENSNNFLVYTAPNEVIFAESDLVNNRIMKMILLLIPLTIIILIHLSKKLSDPIRNVAMQIEDSENVVHDINIPKRTFLEINIFIRSYNNASKRVKELLEKVKEESRMKEKAHYEMLMSQISPHFIFNTVNSIRIMSRERNEKDTERALTALGNILHAVYSNKDGMTTVGREVSIVLSYVEIMQFRFGDSFQYYDVLPSNLYFYEIPAFTLQPILENAILHGVKGMKGGQIILSGIEYENDFMISIFNNGNSADKEKIDQILTTPTRNKSAFTGIGLSNVNARLKMLYGDQYGLIFNEKVTNGFEIWIRVPKGKGRRSLI
ncbi:histidine kinase [Blautia liquoris]|uniref:Histidine kinase n=1 Tax=Blautia liquoris TaxID=2779518 RepID=A0A7M2RFT7_9FIRM|nr:sensor histidine kinase [Blautia liquoris]QOV18861.1 histidine kinase [Blautia liquoris]